MMFYYGDECDDDDGKKKTLVMYFENQPVKMRGYCLNSGAMVREAITNAGNSFIINKFKSLNSVKIGNARWNAKGFTNQYNNLLIALKAI
jgi:hypothetical protein